MDVVRDFEQYFDALAKKRRSNPTDDLATAIANGKINDGPMPDLETYGYASRGHSRSRDNGRSDLRRITRFD